MTALAQQFHDFLSRMMDTVEDSLVFMGGLWKLFEKIVKETFKGKFYWKL